MSNLQPVRQDEISALAGAYWVQGGGDKKQATLLARRDATTDPAVKKNLRRILRAMKTDRLNTNLEKLIDFSLSR
ncbi:MAG: hypothetical protein ACE5H2_00395 [Terriglobia bacterium]